MKDQAEQINTKYPIVLVHGLILKDFAFWHAFRGITKQLKNRGVHVYVADHDGVGSIENNAQMLKNEIESILRIEQTDKVNLIAHSKGGLDSRYMISKLDMADKVASLTTLSTPHYGSKMSRKIIGMPKFFAKIICFFVNLFYRIFGDAHPDLMTVGKQLGDTEMEKFNDEVKNAAGVFYQSYSSDISKKKQFLLFIPYKFSKYCENEDTDGIVSASSAQWGEYKGDMCGANHLQMVGAYYGGRKRKKAVIAFYVDLIKQLEKSGY